MRSKPILSIFLFIFLMGLFFCIFIIGKALRTNYNPYTQIQRGGDMASYVALAISLAKGEGFSEHYKSVVTDFFSNPKHISPTEPPKPTARKAVGYPLFLAGIFHIFGYRLIPVIFIQGILIILSTLLIYAIAREVGSWKIAMIAYGLPVFYYPFWYKAILLLVEPLLIFLTLLFIYSFIKWLKEPSVIRGLWTGMVAGAVFLVKPVILPGIPLFLLWAYFKFRRQKQIKIFIIGAIWLITGLTLILAPLAVRNYRYSKRIFITPTFGGYQMLLIYNTYNLNFMSYPQPGFANETYPGFYESLLPSLKVNLSDSTPPILVEYLQDQAYAKSAIKFIISHPRHFFKALLRNFWNMWRMDYLSAIPLRKMTNLVCYVGMIPFFFLGTWLAIRKRNDTALFIALFFGYFFASHLLFTSLIRYRITIMPLFFILAAFGLNEAFLARKVK